MNTAITYGVEVWLADLAANGWTLTVSERRSMRPTTLRCVEDDFEPMTLLAPAVRVGVLAANLADGREGSGVFVPCRDEEAAHALLERVLNEEV